MKQSPLLYVLTGEDSFLKDEKIKGIKETLLDRDTESFNSDVLYGRDTSLMDLQERLLCLPVRSAQRLLVIKDADSLRQEVRTYLSGYADEPRPHVVLVLDFRHFDPKDEFQKKLGARAVVLRFKEELRPDAFVLSRQIESRRADGSLRVLHELLKNGEKPERILGGLRYSLLRNAATAAEKKRRLRLLLDCDIDIKTGRLKPPLALEKIIIQLCCLKGAASPSRSTA